MTTDTTALQERLALAISEAEFCRRCEALSMSCEACEARAAAVLPVVKAAQREAVAPVLALHNADGKRWEGFPRADRRVTYCTHCQLAAPCPTVRAVSIEQETQP